MVAGTQRGKREAGPRPRGGAALPGGDGGQLEAAYERCEIEVESTAKCTDQRYNTLTENDAVVNGRLCALVTAIICGNSSSSS